MRKAFKVTSYRQEDLLKMEEDQQINALPNIPKPLPPTTVVAENHSSAELIARISLEKLHHCKVVVIQTTQIK